MVDFYTRNSNFDPFVCLPSMSSAKCPCQKSSGKSTGPQGLVRKTFGFFSTTRKNGLFEEISMGCFFFDPKVFTQGFWQGPFFFLKEREVPSHVSQESFWKIFLKKTHYKTNSWYVKHKSRIHLGDSKFKRINYIDLYLGSCPNNVAVANEGW